MPETTTTTSLLSLAELSRAIKQHPLPFGRQAQVAFGAGTTDAPIWLSVQLNKQGPAQLSASAELPNSAEAAIFLSEGSEQNLVAGDRSLLEKTLRHYLGGVDLLNLRVSRGASS